MAIEKSTPNEGERKDEGVGLDSGGHARANDAAWEEFLACHRDRLRRMVALRLDVRLKGHVDPSDVIQEAFLEATKRREENERQAEPMPLFLWLRFLTIQRLQIAHRRHLGTQSRDVSREISIWGIASPPASSAAIAAQLLGRELRPSEAAIRSERKLRLQEALDTMDVIDREILVLRHFEQLSNSECAQALGLGESAATKRYIRALKRLKGILSAFPGTGAEFWQ